VRGKKDLLATLALAACTGIIVNQIQSLLQLGYRQTPLFSMTMIFMGLGVAAWYAKQQRAGFPKGPAAMENMCP
jgi:hypothetical protein